MPQNPKCDGGHCEAEEGEVRIMPIRYWGIATLCRACYEFEVKHLRAKGLLIPQWESLQEIEE